MARRRGTSSGRYSKGTDYVARARQSSKDRRLKARNPDKYKRRKKVAKASSDGKITKKEGQKLARKGVSLQKIQNRNISEYRQAGRDTDRRNSRNARRGTSQSRPGFEPLKIKRGAYEALSGRSRGGGGKQQPRRRGGGGGGGSRPDPGPTNQYQSQIEDILGGEQDQMVYGQPVADPYADALASLQQTIAGIQMPNYGAELEAMRVDQENYMRELAAQNAAFERERELAFRTSQENAARGGMTADFRIGARSPRDRMGTGGFKRRPRRRAAVAAQGITPTSSAAYNANPNTAEARGINLAAINRAPVGYSKV